MIAKWTLKILNKTNIIKHNYSLSDIYNVNDITQKKKNTCYSTEKKGKLLTLKKIEIKIIFLSNYEKLIMFGMLK